MTYNENGQIKIIVSDRVKEMLLRRRTFPKEPLDAVLGRVLENNMSILTYYDPKLLNNHSKIEIHCLNNEPLKRLMKRHGIPTKDEVIWRLMF